MRIYLAADHAGFELKDKLISFLKDLGYEVEDKGALSYNEDDDYPDFVKLIADEVGKDPKAKGIVIGKSGQGEAMCANRVKGVRAVVFYAGPMDIIRLSRQHNDTNVLSLAAGFLDEEEAKVAVKTWIETPFSGDERHVRRIAKLDN